jgi:hypothetical protein
MLVPEQQRIMDLHTVEKLYIAIGIMDDVFRLSRWVRNPLCNNGAPYTRAVR